MENLKDKDQLEEVRIAGREICQWVFTKQDLIYLAQDKDTWWTPVNNIMNLQFA